MASIFWGDTLFGQFEPNENTTIKTLSRLLNYAYRPANSQANQQ